MVVLLAWAALAGRFLIVSRVQPSDLIVVLDGGTRNRLLHGLELLHDGLAPRLVIETGAGSLDWGVPDINLARAWVSKLPEPEPNQVTFCQVSSFSTRQDVSVLQACMDGAHRVLLVTSEYHTRRALSIFTTLDQSRVYGVAAAREPVYFGAEWWRHREWAKTTFAEWSRLLWWECVDRWR